MDDIDDTIAYLEEVDHEAFHRGETVKIDPSLVFVFTKKDIYFG